MKRDEQIEATAWGVAALAGMRAGLIQPFTAAKNSKKSMTFYPSKDRQAQYKAWRKAVSTALYYSE